MSQNKKVSSLVRTNRHRKHRHGTPCWYASDKEQLLHWPSKENFTHAHTVIWDPFYHLKDSESGKRRCKTPKNRWQKSFTCWITVYLQYRDCIHHKSNSWTITQQENSNTPLKYSCLPSCCKQSSIVLFPFLKRIIYISLTYTWVQERRYGSSNTSRQSAHFTKFRSCKTLSFPPPEAISKLKVVKPYSPSQNDTLLFSRTVCILFFYLR